MRESLVLIVDLTAASLMMLAGTWSLWRSRLMSCITSGPLHRTSAVAFKIAFYRLLISLAKLSLSLSLRTEPSFGFRCDSCLKVSGRANCLICNMCGIKIHEECQTTLETGCVSTTRSRAPSLYSRKDRTEVSFLKIGWKGKRMTFFFKI